MDLAPFHLWIVWIHVVGVFLFLIGHGVSAGVAWRLRTERDPVAVRTLLDFSRRAMSFALIGFLLWFFGGILAGFSGNGGAGFWTTGTYWIWVSLALALIVIIAMTPMGRMYFNRVRAALGVDEKTGAADPNFTVDAGALDAAIMSGRPTVLASMGIGLILILSWLMFFKPF